MVADQRKYQIVVLGATGFTGQRVAKEIIESGFKGSYALAGRDESKLKHLASSLQIKSAGILIANVNDPSSLQAMASQAQVIINCVGPFRFYGQPVVAACISQKTSYLDICGEPEFIERMELHYHSAAAAAGIHIASAVGFDSVPVDLGSLWTTRLFNNTGNNNNNSKAVCTRVETFISIKSGPAGIKGHYPTWESAVNGVGFAAELTAIRKQAKSELFYHHESIASGKNATAVGKLKRHGGPFYDTRLQSWALPFIGADASVVRRTMAMEASMKQDRGRRGHKAPPTRPTTITSPLPSPPPQSAIYFTVPSFFYLILFIIAGTVFQILARKEWGRRLLLKYPAFFSFGGFIHQGPSEEQLQQTRFEIVNFAKGVEYSNDNNSNGPSSPPSPAMQERSVVTSITGPEPGYVACSIFIVAAAIVMLEERDKLPPPGVWTPGMLLIDTTGYIERVRRRGVEFSIVSRS